MGFIILELSILPYLDVFARPGPVQRVLDELSTAVFLLDLALVSWRLVHENSEIKSVREAVAVYARTWLALDLLGAMPWGWLGDSLTLRIASTARVLRAAKLRT